MRCLVFFKYRYRWYILSLGVFKVPADIQASLKPAIEDLLVIEMIVCLLYVIFIWFNNEDENDISIPIQEYPEYYQVIKRPMDMQRIQQKIISRGYDQLEDMVNDFLLMFDNACKFNEPDSLIYKVCIRSAQGPSLVSYSTYIFFSLYQNGTIDLSLFLLFWIYLCINMIEATYNFQNGLGQVQFNEQNVKYDNLNFLEVHFSI